jgi:hypothetical protein
VQPKTQYKQHDCNTYKNYTRNQMRVTHTGATKNTQRVTAYKSGAQDEWAMVNELMVKAGFDAEARKQEARRAQKQHFKKQLDEQVRRKGTGARC